MYLQIHSILIAAKLGANAILGVSMACCRAAAAEKVLHPPNSH
jgi:enolase